MMLVVDYASVDDPGKPDFAAAYRAGIRAAIVRGAYGAWPDPVALHRDAIRSAGMTYGSYLFLVAHQSAPTPEDQVAAFLKQAGLIPGKDLPPALDIEFPRGIAATGRSRSELGAWTGRAVAALRKETGVDPIAYSSARVLDGDDADALAGAANEAIRGCPLWLARYPYASRRPAVLAPDIPPPPVPKVAGDADDYCAHQYQGDALGVPGFSSTVDLSRWNVLRKGAHGARVAWAQRRLRMADGTPAVFDDAMESAVREFQAAHGLEVDGIVGVRTWAALAWVRV